VPSRRLIVEQENKRLTTYGWVDPKVGVVRIPVEEAMKLLAERGLPARDVNSQPSTATAQRLAAGTDAGSPAKPGNKETEKR
jgi:hypothetical protein